MLDGTDEGLNRQIAFAIYGRQYGHDGMHNGIGSPDCPKHLHHHHDERCTPPDFVNDPSMTIKLLVDICKHDYWVGQDAIWSRYFGGYPINQQKFQRAVAEAWLIKVKGKL